MKTASNQWYRDNLKRKELKLHSLTTTLFEDMEAKDEQIAELDTGIGSLINEIYELQKKLNAKLDKKHNLLAIREQLLQEHDKAGKELYRVMKELESIENDVTLKEAANQ